MKTVVIFGGSGFIGQNIIRRLSKQGYHLIVPYQRLTNEAKLRLYGNVGQIVPLRFKRLNEYKIKSVINNADIILNLKTIWQEKKGYSYEKNIFHFNIQLVDLLNTTDRKKIFIFFSGLGVSEQSLSKRIKYIAKAENYILENLKRVSIIRPSIVIGRGDQFLGKILPIFKLSFFIPLFGTGEAKLQPVFVDDVANAIEIILEKGFQDNHIYELAGPEIITYKNLYQFIANCLGLRRKLVPIPFWLAKIGVAIIEKTHLNLITKDQLLLFKDDNIFSNQNKSFRDLGISPKNLREVIKKILL